jgi:hypothetical protein
MQDKYYQTSPVKKIITAPGPYLALVSDGLEVMPALALKARSGGLTLLFDGVDVVGLNIFGVTNGEIIIFCSRRKQSVLSRSRIQ